MTEPKLFDAKIEGDPTFIITLDAECLKLIHKCGEHHYDGKCNDAVRVGGFVYGWINMATMLAGFADIPNEKLCSVRATWRQLDLVCKILEQGDIISDINHAKIFKMRQCFGRLFAEASECSKRWTAEVPALDGQTT